MKAILGAFLLSGMLGCTSSSPTTPVLCKTAYKAAFAASIGVSGALGCKDQAAVAADFVGYVQNTTMCKDVLPTGQMADLVCPLVVTQVIKLGVGKLPADWGCSGGVSGDKLEQVLTDACKKAVPY